MSGWQSYYRYHPLYVFAEGSALKTFITFPSDRFLWPQLNFCPCLNCDDLHYLIKEGVKGPVWYRSMVPPVDKLLPS